MTIPKSHVINVYTGEIRVMILSNFSLLSRIDGKWEINFTSMKDMSKEWKEIKLICKLEKKI